MLPSDLVLVQDDSFKKHVLAYAKDQEVRRVASVARIRRSSPHMLCAQLFYSDFSKAVLGAVSVFSVSEAAVGAATAYSKPSPEMVKATADEVNSVPLLPPKAVQALPL